MPRISEFYGIVIALYYNDHAPPHFHAIYAETEGRVRIDALDWLPGNSLPSRAARLTLEWATLHRDELLTAWERVRAGEVPDRIDPLP